MSIPDEIDERKGWFLFSAFIRRKSPHLYIPAIILLVGILSFSLGRLSGIGKGGGAVIIESAVEQNTEGVLLKEKTEREDIKGESVMGATEVVASKNGSVYYLPWCSQVQRIKPENLISFPSFEAARAAGYMPSVACKGVE